MIKLPEVLAPCGNEESFEAALASGADAVYLAGDAFGARAYAGNFLFQDLPRIIGRAHLFGMKVYLTLNTLMKEKEFRGLYDLLLPLEREGLDACLVQDLGLFMWLKKHFPVMPLHASTQMNITGPAGARLLGELGAARIVAAREMSLEEIREMKEESGLEVEVFVHGAMCVSYSGRCLFSSCAGERSGNRGRCAQPCRKGYGRDFALSMKDLSALPFLPELMAAGVDSLKIEGRMKQPVYTATVTRVYKEAVQAVARGSFTEEKLTLWEEELSDAFSRGDFGRGYLHGGKELLTKDTSGRTGVEVGVITGTRKGRILIRTSRPVAPGDELHPEGHPDIRLTSNLELKRGEEGELFSPGTGKLTSGTALIRTRSSVLERGLEELLKHSPRKKIRGEFSAYPGKSLELSLSAEGKKGPVIVILQGEIPQRARNRETEEDEIREKLSAMGGTEFIWEKLSLHLTSGLFIRASECKRMRREGLQLLREAVAASWRRPAEPFDEREAVPCTKTVPAWYGVAYHPRQAEELLENLAAGRDWLILEGGSGRYLPEDLDRLIRAGKERNIRVAVGLPFVTRKPDFPVRDMLLKKGKETEGLYIHSPEDLAEVYFRLRAGESIPDNLILASSLYVLNREAAAFFISLFPGKNVILEGSTELTEGEHLSLMESPLPRCYGKEELMITSARNEKPEGRILRDDHSHEFFIFSAKGLCYNIILNGVPVSLHQEGLSGGFLHFTTETPERIKEVTDLFTGKERECSFSYTRGHWTRGVL